MAGTLVSTTIPNLINGVSQQPYALRLASQAEVQENCHSSVVEGLTKRAGTTHKARITTLPAGGLFTHVINRDSSERYQAVVSNGDLKVFDIRSGAEKTVNFPDGKAYLLSNDPSGSFKAVTVADFTFIINKAVAARAGASLSPTRTPEALVWIKQGAYGTKYTVKIDNSSFTVETPDGSTASHINNIQTDRIASDLVAAMSAGTGGDFTFDQNGSSIRITRTNGGDFGITISDSQGDQATKLIKGTTQRFSDLPARGFEAFSVEVAGDQASSFDNYYVSYDTSSNSSGVWLESMKGGEQYTLDASTMAHALVREADGTFTFKQIAWEPRKTGDADGNPMPSFVGKTFNDIFFHRNRLGFVADENVVFSRSGDFFNFFRSSATQVLDTDPIDVAVSHIKVSIIQHAIPFNETLLLFSEQTQFQLGAADLLTPETISINQTTEFECSLKARPVGAGRNIYFTFNRGAFSGLREYYVDGDTNTNDAVDVTSHVPAYVPSGITKMTASSSEDMVAMISENQKNTVFVYKYYWNEQEKLQSAWYKWTFPNTDEILSIDFLESDLYLTIRRADGVYFESMSVNPGFKDEGFDFGVHLDRKITDSVCGLSYDSVTNQTYVDLPFAVHDMADYQLITRVGDVTRKPGQVVEFTQVNSTRLRAVGNVSKFFFGRSFTMAYRFSTFVIKEEAVGGGQMTVGEGRIQLRKASVTYDHASYFRVEVTPLRRQTYRYIFSGRIIGSAQNLIGQIPIESGRFDFPIMSKNDQVTIDIINDSHLPCAFLSAEWEALYVIRSKRL